MALTNSVKNLKKISRKTDHLIEQLVLALHSIQYNTTVQVSLRAVRIWYL